MLNALRMFWLMQILGIQGKQSANNNGWCSLWIAEMLKLIIQNKSIQGLTSDKAII